MTPSATGEYIPLKALGSNAKAELNDNEAAKEQVHRKNSTVWQRLGTTSILILFLGCPLILLAMTLLAVFWHGSMQAINGEEPSIYWMRIINRGWAPQLVTICATVIRTAVAFQLGLATAMIAGIVLETSGVPLLLVPLYSMLRAFKAAPSNLLTATSFRPHTSRFIYALTLTEVLLTVGSQFLSTIFLSDFGSRAITQRSISTNVSILQLLATGHKEQWWSVPPSTSWTFAERSGSFAARPGFHDTGHTFRAFLPFQEEAQRTKLRQFNGPAPVMDHRVVCASPPLLNLSISQTARSSEGSSILSGLIPTANLTYPLLPGPKAPPHISFHCKLPDFYLGSSKFNLDNTEGETSLCIANGLEGFLSFPFLNEDPLAQSWQPQMPLFMMLDVVSASALKKASEYTSAVETIRTDSPWTIISTGSDNIETVRISACLTSLVTETFIVGMNSTSDTFEPKTAWDQRTANYNTEHSRLQLGVLSQDITNSTDSRGILTLNPRSQWKIIPPSDGRYFFLALFLDAFVRPVADNTTFDPVIVLPRTGLDKLAVHPTHTSLFQDTLILTGSPAWALQALFTRVHQMRYYERLIKLKSPATAVAAFSLTATIPVQWKGFMLGTALIATHLFILAVVLIAFMRSTEMSFLGCYWQTVAQLVSDETQSILKEADRMDDKAVKEWIAREDLPDSLGGRWVLRGSTRKRITRVLRTHTAGDTGTS